MTSFAFKPLALACALGALCASVAFADSQWIAAPDKIAAGMRAGSREAPVQPGDETRLAITKAAPGSSFTVLRGTELLTPEPVAVDDKGAANISIKVPTDAEIGIQPLTVISHNPPGVALVNLKLSEVVPPLGQDKYDMTSVDVGERAYQAGLSADGKLYVSSARGKEQESALLVFDAATLAPEGEFEIPVSADPEDGVVDVFGIGVDDAHGRVWATNTLNNTVTVYDVATRKAVKVFDEGSIEHPRDVVIDQANNRAYVNAALTGEVVIYDTDTLEQVGSLHFDAANGREVFGTMSLALDAAGGKLFTVSRDTRWVGWADLATGKTTSVEVPQMIGGSGIAHDPETGRIFVASQDSDNLVVLDAEGKLIADTTIGAGGVSAVFDPQTRHVYASTRAGGTVAVLDVDGKLLANLPLGDVPNQLVLGKDGAVYAIAMYGAPGDDKATGHVTRITPRP